MARGLRVLAILGSSVLLLAAAIASAAAPPEFHDAGSDHIRPSGLGLARAPVLGITCGNVVTKCNRLGIAVWLTKPASEVDASLVGVHVRLRPPRGRAADYWSGFVHVAPGSLRLPYFWDGAHPKRTLTLHVRVHYGSGWRSGNVRVRLSPGWG